MAWITGEGVEKVNFNAVLTHRFIIVPICDTHVVKAGFHHGLVGTQLVVEPWL